VNAPASNAPPGTIPTPLGWHRPDFSDFEVRLVIKGRPFVLKNSKKVIPPKGRRKRYLLLPSDEAEAYLKAATLQLRSQWVCVFRKPIPETTMLNREQPLPGPRRCDAGGWRARG
jgi:hypothetical protein